MPVETPAENVLFFQLMQGDASCRNADGTLNYSRMAHVFNAKMAEQSVRLRQVRIYY